MADPKKGLAAMIIAKAKPAPMMEEPAEMEAEADPKQAAAEELMDALKSGDAAAVVEAFSAMAEMCQHSESEPEME